MTVGASYQHGPPKRGYTYSSITGADCRPVELELACSPTLLAVIPVYRRRTLIRTVRQVQSDRRTACGRSDTSVQQTVSLETVELLEQHQK